MKYTGFLKEVELNIKNSEYLKDMLFSNKIEDNLRTECISYLKKGIVFAATMTFIYDDENQPIGGVTYQTDGEYIWPNYYIYYLEKYENFKIDTDFLKFIKSINFTIPQLSKKQIIEIDRIFSNEWSGKNIPC